jgi:hypothetical protein
MSLVYWGIVGGLAAMVATLFFCVDVLYSDAKGSPGVSSGKADRPAKTVKQPSRQGRHAA